jgi:hypothetical protein
MAELAQLQEQLSDIKTQKAIEENNLKKLTEEAKNLGVKSLDNAEDFLAEVKDEIASLEEKQSEHLEKAQKYLDSHEI